MKIHDTADVSKKANIGEETQIWNNAQVRENATVGTNCILGKNVYIDFDVIIGNNCKIQNNVSIYHGTRIENKVFIGPHVVFTNDKSPRATNPDGSLQTDDDWISEGILVKDGASIGANSTILPGITIGKYAMIGAGSVVTKNVPDYALVYGNPATVKGKVDEKGKKI